MIILISLLIITNIGQCWNYKEHGKDWIFGMCYLGSKQSPIEVVTTIESKEGDLPEPSYQQFHLELDYFNYTGRQHWYSFRFLNNGESLFLGLPIGDSRLYLHNVEGSKGRVGYNLGIIKIHIPSEHLFNGERTSLEMQFIHYKDTLQHPKLPQQTIISLLFSTQVDTDNDLYGQILIDKLNINTLDPIKDLDLSTLASHFGAYYLFYNGSLTVPLCMENINWFINTKLMKITSQQVDQLKKFPIYQNYGGNYRDLQDLNQRIIYSNDPKYHMNNSALLKGIYPFLLLLFFFIYI